MEVNKIKWERSERMKKSKLDNEKIYKMRKKGIYIPYNFPNERCIILPTNKEKMHSELKNT